MGKSLKQASADMLTSIVGEEQGKAIMEATFPKQADGWMPGEVLTFGQLKQVPEGSILHIRYLDDDDEEREDGFFKFSKTSEDEYCIGAYPFPVRGLTDDQELRNIDNSGWSFTIRAAVPAKKGKFQQMKKNQRSASKIMEKMQELISKSHNADKAKKKEINKKLKELEKDLRKIIKI